MDANGATCDFSIDGEVFEQRHNGTGRDCDDDETKLKVLLSVPQFSVPEGSSLAAVFAFADNAALMVCVSNGKCYFKTFGDTKPEWTLHKKAECS